MYSFHLITLVLPIIVRKRAVLIPVTFIFHLLKHLNIFIASDSLL